MRVQLGSDAAGAETSEQLPPRGAGGNAEFTSSVIDWYGIEGLA
jgi:hypothetical protein